MSTSLNGVLVMSEIIKSEGISRRNALSLFGKVAAFAVAASTTALTVSDAEAETVGMERRQDRRAGRHERREDRRVGRHERREDRRTGSTTDTGTTTGMATGQKQ
jgi:Ni/Co efflux regulator RcnB